MRKATKANSDTSLKRRPARTDSPSVKPNNWHKPVMIVALRAMMPNTMEATNPNLEVMSPKSISKPTLKKNIPTKTPRKGEISASIFSLCFEAANIIPDTNEPSVLLNPKPSVKKDMPNTVDRTSPTNASWFCDETTKSNSGSKINFAHTPRADNAMTNATPAFAKAFPMLPPPPAKSGVTTNNGTTAKSCIMSTPNEDFPCRVSNCCLSLRSCNTNAELDSAIPPPRTIIAADDIPQRCAIPATLAVVKSTWASPNPKTSFFMLMRVSKSMCKPISNRKKTIPKSASISVRWRSSMIPPLKPLGPNAMPAARKPRMLEMPRRLHNGATRAVVPSSEIVSDLAPLKDWESSERRLDTMLVDGDDVAASPPRGMPRKAVVSAGVFKAFSTGRISSVDLGANATEDRGWKGVWWLRASIPVAVRAPTAAINILVFTMVINVNDVMSFYVARM
mmetsp:Transcript_29253/g.62989  ORF Transcript_29253/g.62989 Transcript_29253/m.62989 type:complete len:450 (-) Transcript_29253:26-1375(-)